VEKRFGFTACFVTKGLPFAWTGGNRAITQMQEACKAKGTVVCGTAIMTWGGRSAEKIANLAGNLAGFLEGQK